MSYKWWHLLVVIAIGIAIDYFFPSLADMTLGKVTPRK